MIIKWFLFVFLFYSATVCSGQASADKDFESFAKKQDSLMVCAYDKRDVKAYNKLLNGLLEKYNKLSPADKKIHSGALTNAYYNFCCIYSILNDKAMALSYLKKSIDAGYYDYPHVQEDKDLDNIRNENEFKTLVEPLRNISDYLYILKTAGKYNADDHRAIPKWTYQAPDNPNLMALRKAYNLDSIAGQGDDVSKIINLLQWVHYLIPHDGNHDNPIVKNAMSMIAECKGGNRGLNCRGLATVLNECYLSLGIKSRIVTCLPKDSLDIDGDCHVINMVFSDSLKKWLWIDPTNDAYIMNEKGELLGIEEVRERLINDKPILLNPDANWNRKMTTTKEEYLYHYMAKNLYILECPVNSEYNMETRVKDKIITYVALLPLDYFKQSPDKTKVTDQTTSTTLINYKTNNANLFWQAP